MGNVWFPDSRVSKAPDEGGDALRSVEEEVRTLP